MGVPHTLQQDCLQVICFLGHRARHIGYCHSWHHQENAKDTIKGNSQGRANKRGNNDNNLVVIEFKGWWSQESQKKDISKLNDLVDPNGIYKYKYGSSIKFNNVEKGTDRYNITEVKCNILD